MTDPNTILAVSENISTSLASLADTVQAATTAAPTESASGLISDTALFYTFSTIAQTLAGAFGILGAFILFRLQGINNTCQSICEAILNRKRRYERHLASLEFAYLKQNWVLFKTNLAGLSRELIYQHYAIVDSEIDYHLEHLDSLFNKKDTIKNYIKNTLIHTVIVIGLSLILLGFTPLLSKSQIVSIVCLVATVGYSIKCIISYKVLVIEALELDDNGESEQEQTPTEAITETPEQTEETTEKDQ